MNEVFGNELRQISLSHLSSSMLVVGKRLLRETIHQLDPFLFLYISLGERKCEFFLKKYRHTTSKQHHRPSRQQCRSVRTSHTPTSSRRMVEAVRSWCSIIVRRTSLETRKRKRCVSTQYVNVFPRAGLSVGENIETTSSVLSSTSPTLCSPTPRPCRVDSGDRPD